MPKNLTDLSDFQNVLLKQEIEIIDKTIGRIDQVQQSMKNWCIPVWGGSLYLAVKNLEQSYFLVLLTVIIPILSG